MLEFWGISKSKPTFDAVLPICTQSSLTFISHCTHTAQRLLNLLPPAPLTEPL